MRKALLSKTEILSVLLSEFRISGYEGVSMSRISEVTGLGKASLYHHFPG
ncbi:MAG: TetR/AcrR family transcriptional regulator, partial [Proteobacteria bacterium]